MITVPLKASYTSASYPIQAIVMHWQDTLAIYLVRKSYTSQVFILQAFTYFYQSLSIVDLCLSLELLQVFKGSV